MNYFWVKVDNERRVSDLSVVFETTVMLVVFLTQCTLVKKAEDRVKQPPNFFFMNVSSKSWRYMWNSFNYTIGFQKKRG